MNGLEDFSADLFLTAPAGVGARARLDADGLLRAVDAILQGWVSGKVALGEGDLLSKAFGGIHEWVPHVTQRALGAILTHVEAVFLPNLASQVLAIAARFPEVQGPAENAAKKLEERINLVHAASIRLAQSAPASPLRGVLDDYTAAYTALNLARARIPPDAAAEGDARKQVGLHFDAVTRAHATLEGGLDAITAAASRFFASVGKVPPAKVTPAQRRTAMEYGAIIDTLKGAWVFPVPAMTTPAPLPGSRGRSFVNRVFAALHRSKK